MANTYVLLNSSTLASTATSVTFSSIPQTYTDLILKISARSTSGGNPTSWVQGTWNSISSNYYETYLYANNNGTLTASSGRVGPQVVWGASGWISSDSNSATANTFGVTEIYLPSYTAAQNKPYGIFSASESNDLITNTNVTMMAGLLVNTAAVSSVVIQSSGTFAIGSSFYLYGIKNS